MMGGGRAKGGGDDREAGISKQSRTAFSLRPIFTSQIMPLQFYCAKVRRSNASKEHLC